MAITRCPHCEFLLLPEEAKAHTCAGCGAVLNPDAPPPSPAKPEVLPALATRSRVLPWLGGIVVVAAMAGAAVWGWQQFHLPAPRSAQPESVATKETPQAASEQKAPATANESPKGKDNTSRRPHTATEKEVVREMDLHGKPVSDEQLEHLGHLTGLNVLILTDTPVDDSGLRRLATLRELRVLDLSGTKITDAGLAQLSGLTKLHTLLLKGCAIHDAGLIPLAALKRLRTLDLSRTRVSDRGVERLQQQRPELRIER